MVLDCNGKALGDTSLTKQYNRDKILLSVEEYTAIFEVSGCRKGC
jgi:hypothetical protein